MPRFKHNDEIVDAVRYQPGRAGHIIHRLSELGIPCLHLRPGTGAIDIFDASGFITIRDPRHDLGGTQGVGYPGNWIVWRNLLAIEIVPNQIFETEYVPLA